MTLENAMWLILGMGIALVFVVPVAYYTVREERRAAREEIDDILMSVEDRR